MIVDPPLSGEVVCQSRTPRFGSNNKSERIVIYKKGTITSESVSEGHPDKVADQISDAILDALLEQDSSSRVACETLVNWFGCFGGEITSNAKIDYAAVARETILDIGYDDGDIGFDGKSCGIITAIDQQSFNSSRSQRGSRD